MNDLLISTREQLATERKRWTFPYRPYHRLTRPIWMPRDSPFERLFQDYKMLLAEGSVVWGYLVQAYTRRFETGRDDFAATVIFSLEPYIEGELTCLEVKSRLFHEFKVRTVHTPDAQQFCEAMSRGAFLFNEKLPNSMTTFGRNVYVTNIVVYRKHLPVSCLQSNWFPMLVRLDQTPASMILPSRYWDARLVNRWLQRMSLPVGAELQLLAGTRFHLETSR